MARRQATERRNDNRPWADNESDDGLPMGLNLGIGAVMRRIRKQHRWTLRETAAALDMDPSNLSRVERGIQNATEDIISAFAAYAGMVPSKLVALTENGRGTELGAINARRVPLIAWEDIAGYIAGDAQVKPKLFVETPVGGLSANIMAVAVESDAMEPRIPAGAVVIIDRDAPSRAGDIIVAAAGPGSPPLLRQLVIESGQRFLKPFNDHYPITISGKDMEIIGVARKLIMDI